MQKTLTVDGDVVKLDLCVVVPEWDNDEGPGHHNNEPIHKHAEYELSLVAFQKDSKLLFNCNHEIVDGASVVKGKSSPRLKDSKYLAIQLISKQYNDGDVVLQHNCDPPVEVKAGQSLQVTWTVLPKIPDAAPATQGAKAGAFATVVATEPE